MDVKTHNNVSELEALESVRAEFIGLTQEYAGGVDWKGVRQAWVEPILEWDGKSEMPVPAIEWPDGKAALCFRVVLAQIQARYTAKQTLISPEIITYLAACLRSGLHIEVHPVNWAQVEIVVFAAI